MIERIQKWTSKTEFNSQDDFDTNPYAKIICPSCSQVVNVKMKDLKRHQG